MTIIAVNGTALQPAIDAASSGDKIVPAAGGYAGPLVIPRDISLLCDGGVRIETAQQTGLIGVSVMGSGMKAPAEYAGFELVGGGAGIRWNDDVKGSVAHHIYTHDVHNMVRDTPTPTNDDNGGNGWQFHLTSNLTFHDVEFADCRAPTLNDYKPVDGGALDFYGVKNIHGSRVKTRNCVNILELGAPAAGPYNQNITFDDCDFYGRPFPGLVQTPANVSQGMLLRAILGFGVTNSRFWGLDWWDMLLDNRAGTFSSGGIGNVTLTGNEVHLFAGMNRWLTIKALPDRSTIKTGSNRIYANGSACVIEIDAARYVTQSTWPTDLEVGSYAGPEETTPAWVIRGQLATAQSAITSTQSALANSQSALAGSQAALAAEQRAHADDVAADTTFRTGVGVERTIIAASASRLTTMLGQ